MSQELTWPPPPNSPDPLAEYDGFLADLVRAPVKKSLFTQPPLSRRRLVQALRRHTGMYLRPCRDVVDSFCDRHAIFPRSEGFRAWGMPLANTVLFGSCFLSVLFEFICYRMMRQLPASEIPAFAGFMIRGLLVLGGLMVLSCCFMSVAAFLQTRYRRQEAEGARKKLS